MHPAPALPDVVVIETPNLGDRSYVVHLDGLAVVVDPQRDLDRVEAVLAEHGLTVTHVVETHIHNDYVSGGLVLARQLGAVYVVPAGYALDYDATQLGDGETFVSGRMAWRTVHTPGHTPQHLSYVVAADRSARRRPRPALVPVDAGDRRARRRRRARAASP